ncbi:MAG TPA: winged helix-turn-helix domain-containing protein [Capillimicrobium sp.]|nr:winged helix-turn-helix domain-containing protein [Capillimicrobium sp.]
MPPSFRPRELTDPRAMRALSHPTRLALLEALALHGRPLTATEAADEVGESPSSCSFHLRQLAKYGFVEEADGATGRRRPWRLTRIGLSFSVEPASDDETAIAAAGLERVLRDRHLARAAAALDTRAALPREWQSLTGLSQFMLHVTPEELREVQEELLALLLRYHDRLVDPAKRPDGSHPVEVLTLAYPVQGVT